MPEDNLKGITVEGIPLEEFIEKEKAKEHIDHTKAEIISMRRSIRRHNPKLRSITSKASLPKTIRKEKTMNMEETIELRGIYESHKLPGATIFLLQKGNELSSTGLASIIGKIRNKEILSTQTATCLRKILKSQIGSFIQRNSTSGLLSYTLKEPFRIIDWKDLYSVYSNSRPDTLYDLKRKYPEAFTDHAIIEEEPELEEEDFEPEEKCPQCQQKAFNGFNCNACGYTTNPPPEEELEEESTFDKFAKNNIEKMLKEKYGKDINVNVKVDVHVTFSLK